MKVDKKPLHFLFSLSNFYSFFALIFISLSLSLSISTHAEIPIPVLKQHILSKKRTLMEKPSKPKTHTPKSSHHKYIAQKLYRQIEVQAEDVTLREFQKPESATSARCLGQTPDLDSVGVPVFENSIACPVLLNPNKKGRARFHLPVGTRILVLEELRPNTVRYPKKNSTTGKTEIKLSTHAWVRKIQFLHIPGKDKGFLKNFNQRYFVVHRGSLFRGNTSLGKSGRQRCEISEPEDSDVPRLKDTRCFNQLKLQMKSQLSKDGLQFLFHYHEKHRRSRKYKIHDSLVAYIDYSQKNSARRFYLIDLKVCKIIYNTGVSHGGGKLISNKDYKMALDKNIENFEKKLKQKFSKQWEVKKQELLSRYATEKNRNFGHCSIGGAHGYVRTCTHPQERIHAWRILLGKRKLHDYLNMTRPGLFYTLRTDKRMKPKIIEGKTTFVPRWPLTKIEDKEFNSLIWVGMDKRSRKAVSKGVKPHSANYAPVGRSYGCSALKPQDLKNLVELGWDQRVMTFVWVPQCEYF